MIERWLVDELCAGADFCLCMQVKLDRFLGLGLVMSEYVILYSTIDLFS